MPKSSTNATPLPAREQILESAILLMRQSGLSGAGINQILAHSHAPKGSMYYYFPHGKSQITGEALAIYGQRVATAFEAVLSAKRAPAEKIRALFRYIADRLIAADCAQSCAVGAVALDLNAEVADTGHLLAEIMGSWQAVIARHLPIRSRTRKQSFAGLVISAIEGGYVRGRAEGTATALLEAGEWLARLIESESAGSDSPAPSSSSRRSSR